MNNIDYTLTKQDSEQVLNVVEKLYQGREEYRGKVITWDILTNMIGFEMPLSDIAEIRWIDKRPTWVKTINDTFLSCKYQCQLSNVWGQGVALLTGKEVLSNNMARGTRKITQAFDNTFNAIDKLTETYPEAKSLLRTYKGVMIENNYALIGRIDNSRLPGDVRRELKKILQKSLPEHEEEIF